LPTYRSVKPRSREAWRAWLAKHHEKAAGVWLVLAKKHTGLATVAYSDAVEEALCFGWIDTTLNPVDDRFYKQLFTPRNPKGTWAASNKARVERLMAAGLMTGAGLAAIETAKKNGSWTKLDDVEARVVPRELQSALRARAMAKTNWDAYSPGCRKQFLFWLASARRPETRAKRIATIADCAAAGMTYSKFVAGTTKK
jgi:uncharacterized protein YdeI (YjbR/CyaY-like superfamily)